jgi:hypothetical protein
MSLGTAMGRRGLRTSICLVALLVVGAISASAASATVVVLKTKNGGPVSVGTPVTLSLEIGAEELGFACGQEAAGTVTVNGKPKDKVALPSGELHGSCSSEGIKLKWSTALTGIELTGTGKIILRGKASAKIIENTNTCTYEIKKITGHLPIPGSVALTLPGIRGKLNKGLSQGTCEEKTQPFSFAIALATTEKGETLET